MNKLQIIEDIKAARLVGDKALLAELKRQFETADVVPTVEEEKVQVQGETTHVVARMAELAVTEPDVMRAIVAATVRMVFSTVGEDVKADIQVRMDADWDAAMIGTVAAVPVVVVEPKKTHRNVASSENVAVFDFVRQVKLSDLDAAQKPYIYSLQGQMRRYNNQLTAAQVKGARSIMKQVQKG